MKIINFKKFSERLKITRIQNGLSQKELSGQTGISQAIISKYESKNNIRPNAASVYLLAKALNISSEYLLGIEEKTLVFPENEEGKGLKKVENHSSPQKGKKFEYIRMPAENPVDFFIQLEDNSLFPLYKKDDLLFFKTADAPKNNSVILFKLNEDEKNLIRFCQIDSYCSFTAPNKDYPSYRIETKLLEKKVSILGILTGHWGQISNHHKDKNVF